MYDWFHDKLRMDATASSGGPTIAYDTSHPLLVLPPHLLQQIQSTERIAGIQGRRISNQGASWLSIKHSFNCNARPKVDAVWSMPQNRIIASPTNQKNSQLMKFSETAITYSLRLSSQILAFIRTKASMCICNSCYFQKSEIQS
jgi:hypothetical protein